MRGWMAACAALSMTGCTDNSDSDDTYAQSGLCAFHTGDVYEPGLRKDGEQGKLDVVLLDADPDPPDRGENVFTVQIVDHGSDAPRDDVTVIFAPEMPGHGHTTTPAEFTGTANGDGSYEVGPMDLFMGGEWSITVRVHDAAETSDEVVFALCVEG